MAGQVKLQYYEEGLSDLIRQFDQLDRAQQRMITKQLGLNTANKKTKSGFDDIKKAALGMVAPLALATTGAQALRAVAREIENHFRRVKEFQDAAAGKQTTFSASLGAIVANDPTLNRDPARLARFRDFSLAQGQTLGEGGAAQVAAAIADLRSGTTATDDARLAALERAVLAKQLDPATDLAAFAKGIVQATQALEKAGVANAGAQAEAFVATLGGEFAGNAPEAIENLPRLLGLQSLGASPDQLLGLFGAGTKATGDTEGKRTVTALAGLLSKVAANDVTIGGQAVDLGAGTAGDQLVRLISRIEGGEFGSQAIAFKELSEGAGGVTAQSLLNGLTAETLGAAIGRATTGRAGGSVLEGSLATLAAVDPNFADLQSTNRVTGQADVGGILDAGGGAASRARQQIAAFRSLIRDTQSFDPLGNLLDYAVGSAGDADDIRSQGLERSASRAAGFGASDTGLAVQALASILGFATGGVGGVVGIGGLISGIDRRRRVAAAVDQSGGDQLALLEALRDSELIKSQLAAPIIAELRRIGDNTAGRNNGLELD